jgi:uncharacterized membrane protein
LNAGESTTVQLDVTDFSFALKQTYLFEVGAIAQSDSAIRNQAAGTVTFTAEEDVLVSLSPDALTITPSEKAYYLLTITNTGNALTTYSLGVAPLSGTVKLSLGTSSLAIPPDTTAHVLVSAMAEPGMYDLNAMVESVGGATGSALAELQVDSPTAIRLQHAALSRQSGMGAQVFSVFLLLATVWALRRRRRS